MSSNVNFDGLVGAGAAANETTNFRVVFFHGKVIADVSINPNLLKYKF